MSNNENTNIIEHQQEVIDELLEALKDLVKQIKYPQRGSADRDGDMIEKPNIEIAQQAIAKAEGEK